MSDDPKDDFVEFLAAVQCYKGVVDGPTLQRWKQRFDTLWKGAADQWCRLIELLPLRKGPTCDPERLLTPDASEEAHAANAFLAAIGCAHLEEKAWREQLSDNAIKFAVGCINLVHQTEGEPSAFATAHAPKLKEHVCRALALYPGTLAIMQGYGRPVSMEEAGFKVSGVGLVPYDKVRWPDDLEIAEVVKRGSTQDHFLKACAIESDCVSEAFRKHLDGGRTHRLEEDLKLWAGYLVPPHAFEYCWRYVTATSKDYRGQEKPVFGDTVDERIERLKEALLSGIPHRLQREDYGWPSSQAWREALVGIFRPLASLLELDRYHRRESRGIEEAWARQSEAIELISKPPLLIPLVVHGILDHGESHWDVLDPIILGLPQDAVVGVLTEYVAEIRSHDSHYHARLLLAHARGDRARPTTGVHAQSGGILGAVENLITVSRTRMPHDRSQIWLGDEAAESLWLGALEAANKEFVESFDKDFGQDEHEHAFLLAKILERHLTATNATLRFWLNHRRSVPAFLNVSVRRLPKTAKKLLPQEGGRRGLQADLAILMTCEIPELAVADRATLLQAKKAERTRDGNAWLDNVKIDRTQLSRLLEVSADGHYLFLLHSNLGQSPLILPARMVRDVLKAQAAPAIPLSVMLRASKTLPHFLLHDVIGLWTGDTNPKLIEQLRSGEREGQGPHVLIEITLRAGENEQ